MQKKSISCFCYILLFFSADSQGQQGFITAPADPCLAAQKGSARLKELAKDSVFTASKRNIRAAAIDGREHSVTIGKLANGNINSTPVSTGELFSGSINAGWPGAFADIHNHPNQRVPSAGDFYGLVKIISAHPGYDMRFVVTPDATVYALLVIDAHAAKAFVEKYPKQQVPGSGPYFPDALRDEFAEAKSYMIAIQGFSSLIADQMATTLILDKYNSGVVLFRQAPDGNFKRLGTCVTETNGTIKYSACDCP